MRPVLLQMEHRVFLPTRHISFCNGVLLTAFGFEACWVQVTKRPRSFGRSLQQTSDITSVTWPIIPVVMRSLMTLISQSLTSVRTLRTYLLKTLAIDSSFGLCSTVPHSLHIIAVESSKLRHQGAILRELQVQRQTST